MAPITGARHRLSESALRDDMAVLGLERDHCIGSCEARCASSMLHLPLQWLSAATNQWSDVARRRVRQLNHHV